MFFKLWNILLTFGLFQSCRSVVMPPDDDDDRSYSFALELQECFKESGGSGLGPLVVLPCLNRGFVSTLVRTSEEDSFEITDGVSLVKNEEDKSLRTTLLPVDSDWSDYRSLFSAANSLLSRRTLRWDMGAIYPGLILQVAPEVNGAGGFLEFVMDRRLTIPNDRKLSTGRLLVRQMILPMIIGMKINLASLIPLFFLAVALISKKAMVFSKLAVLASGFLGLNSLYLLQQQQQHHQHLILDEGPILTNNLWSSHGFRGVSNKAADVKNSARLSRGTRNFKWEPRETQEMNE